MSIENILTRVADALEANTAAMHEMMKSSGKTPAAAPKAEKPKPEKPKAEKPKEDLTAKAAEIVTGYLKAGDKDDRAKAKANVERINEHFGADRFTAISDLDTALDMLNDLMEGRTPEAFAEEADEDNGDGNLV